MRRLIPFCALGLLSFFSPSLPAWAQEDADTTAPEDAAKPQVWSNQADLGGVYTGGNSQTFSLSLDNVLTGTWAASAFTFRFGGYTLLKADDDRVAVGSEDDFIVLDDQEFEVDQERLYVGTKYRRKLSSRFYWQGGVEWDRDVDAGILSRTVIFAGTGNTWWDRDDLTFRSDYSISYEGRDDEIPDPEVDRTFPAARLTWDYLNKISSNTILTNDFLFSLNLQTATDYRLASTTALTVSMSELFALRTSFQVRYQNLPAFEEIDLYDRDPADPDSIVTGTVLARKKKTDTAFKVTLVVNF